MSIARIARSSSGVFPATSSVNTEPIATQAVQPRALNRASDTLPPAQSTERRTISPQTGFVASTVIAGAERSPALRGFSKWSRRICEYKAHCYFGSVITVVAAVIERDGKILVGQRRRGDTHPLKWEFPGGKVERGESPVDALIRELREELGIEAAIGQEIIRYEYSYGGKSPILLIFKRVVEFTGEPDSHAFEQILWVTPGGMPELDFLEGDVDFVRRLAMREL